MKLHRNDIKEIVNVMEKFPEVEYFELNRDECGIGYTLDLYFFTVIQGYHGEFRVRITDADTW